MSSRTAVSRRSALRLGALALAVAALAACGTPGGAGAASPSSRTPAPTGPSSTAPGGGPDDRPDPVGLIGLWWVEDATGQPAGERSVLRLAADDLSWWRECGVAFGTWRAAPGLLVLDAGRGAVGRCPVTERPGAGPSPATSWLERTARFERDGPGWRLLDAAGREQARLRPGATLAPRPDVDASLTTVPTADAAARAALAEPAPLPAGLRAAAAAQVVGRWSGASSSSRTPARPAAGAKPPFLLVAPDASWSGWDGCNGASGRWLVGDGGRLLVTAGASTAIGCAGLDLPGLWATAARAGVDGRQLVLVDAAGRELVRLDGPSPSPSVTVTHGPVLR